MSASKWSGLAAIALTAVMTVACGDRGIAEDEGMYEREGLDVGRDVGVGTVEHGTYDAEITPFLSQYYRENPMFADDQLGFDVRNGVVTITGDVDTVAERDRLVEWVNAVPGVREVNTTGLNVPNM